MSSLAIYTVTAALPTNSMEPQGVDVDLTDIDEPTEEELQMEDLQHDDAREDALAHFEGRDSFDSGYDY